MPDTQPEGTLDYVLLALGFGKDGGLSVVSMEKSSADAAFAHPGGDGARRIVTLLDVTLAAARLVGLCHTPDRPLLVDNVARVAAVEALLQGIFDDMIGAFVAAGVPAEVAVMRGAADFAGMLRERLAVVVAESRHEMGENLAAEARRIMRVRLAAHGKGKSA